ncbi:MAG: glycosyltransferase family 4 protein [Planctomycetota bacterium]|jgi:glycogen(starch) synthase|nr:glycosyltransferase family 4 protein [Planctomycetota bacterium]MDR1520113.1 glycosyltransferase family 4 protein [Planctomycetota bacterium]
MNIAMFAWEALEGITVGGGALYASRLAAALAKAGHRVRLFTRRGNGQAMEGAVNGVMIRRCSWDRKPVFCDEIAALSRSFIHYFADSLRDGGGYDVVHCHDWLTIGAGIGAAELCGARLATSFHSTEWGRTGIWPDSGDSARIAELERRGIEAADAVVAVSRWTKQKIQEQFHPPDWKCEVVSYGTDFPDPGTAERTFRIQEISGLAPNAPAVLFAGRFSRSGGGDLAARACRLAAKHFPEARFIFIGEGPLENEMRREAGDAAVFFPPEGGAVPPEFYSFSNLVLVPFRRDFSGRAVLPAWAASRPAAVLAGTVPGEFVLPGQNGWVTEAEPAALARVMLSSFADPETSAWMGRNGRVAAETAFTWEGSAQRLAAVYARHGALTPVAEPV